MKWIMIVCVCFSVFLTNLTSVQASTQKRDNSDLTQFDLPLLIGDWYLLNPNPESSNEDFLAIKLTLSSNYDFSIDIQKKDYTVDHWEGLFTANTDTIILGINTPQPQAYKYDSNHNILDLNGVRFTKALPNALAGIWSSEHLGGEGLLASEVDQMDLVLQPDFVFMFKVSSDEGDEVVHQGIYYTEGNHLVLLYPEGEHETTYTLSQDKLTLEGEGGDMFAVLNRVNN
ncbi:hypothetical protein BCU68_00125 [Vibrio sp. 10N.286.49.B3]|uniref:hypothetical protein n=1 Tax=Vibrio sp. 10N.286.49.B3 TaxID=1880855 RepID=UPI000C83FC8B|nr:hypothetical protein [Vibrio sp. 10N.286.49.B3]PMH46874.1 hypothetical protein BCU68_00125 [Vibrio sp. 10N.286.49.B3]